MFEANHLAGRLRAASRGRDAARFASLAGDGTVSYGQLWRQAERCAAALVTAGVLPGDRVAAQVEKSIEAITLYLGTVLAGAVFLPLNPGYTISEIAYFLGDAEPAVFVCDPGREAALRPVAENAGVAEVLTLGADGNGTLAEAVRAETGRFSAVPRAADDLAAILYTSGTTGRSKGAMLSHANLASNSATLRDIWRFTQDDVLIHALPIFHTHGLFVATNVTLLAGGALIFMPRFDPDAVIAALPHATAMMGVPTFYTRLLAHPGLTREAVRGVRLFVSGSAPLLAETHREWTARTGHAILERYGMTETNMSTSNPHDGARRAGTVGLPLPGVELRICAPGTDTVLPTGEVGMIEVRGPNVFKGYWRMPEKTAEELRPDGWFITGDIGVVDAEGYISIVGRGKDLIITGGFNVYPKEVEEAIDAMPGVSESAVFGLPHPDFGEGVAAVVVPAPRARITPADVHAALVDRLAKFKQPKRVWIVDALPRNAMGKVQKNVLRDAYRDAFAPPG